LIRFTTASPQSKSIPTSRVLFAFEGEEGFANLTGSAASKVRKEIAKDGFKGRESEGTWVTPQGLPGTERALVVGLGSREKCRTESYRRAGGRAARIALASRQARLAVAWPDRGLKGVVSEIAQAFAEGLLLGSYRYTRYKTRPEDKVPPMESVVFLASAGTVGQVRKALDTASLYVEGVWMARDLINGAPSDVTPKVLVDNARLIAKANKGVTLKVFGKKELQKMGAGGLLGVNRGSAEEPYLIHLHYKPQGTPKKSVALVGKGITFDSGGLSLKPAGSMETMKMDMSGAAAVLGTFLNIAALAPKVEVHGVIATTENMPGGRAYKPGDVLTALNGKTMEVLNTDAEGRLVLADALTYAERQKPDAMIDMATLTGACVIALGALVAGLLTNDAALAERIKAAAESEGEPLWEMPLVAEYRADIRSKVADIKNIGGNREAGTIIGGLFLQEFVEKTPWVHLDIAGPAWLDRDFPACPHLLPGGTGFMIRSLLAFLRGF